MVKALVFGTKDLCVRIAPWSNSFLHVASCTTFSFLFMAFMKHSNLSYILFVEVKQVIPISPLRDGGHSHLSDHILHLVKRLFKFTSSLRPSKYYSETFSMLSEVPVVVHPQMKKYCIWCLITLGKYAVQSHSLCSHPDTALLFVTVISFANPRFKKTAAPWPPKSELREFSPHA